MNLTLSTYEAKARFSEVIRLVREGRTVHISYHGKPVAEIRPIQEERKKTLEEHLDDLERQGVVSPAKDPNAPIEPIAHRPGALQRFLDERD
ncbi:MAG: type II toxin-antitoxin system prevent-host-death family antitoxin [Acidobacteria bacterium]|nr:type II toxin-antitoxin system prevent-host-death family antitoxin [Acidobacteriota bacterium]MYI96038.1 type II toxin-antitoxin system prevent-host-death family antitoxin [Acidobacteriota bacterium]